MDQLTNAESSPEKFAPARGQRIAPRLKVADTEQRFVVPPSGGTSMESRGLPPKGGTTNDEPPLRVMALHAMLYCERLFYLEEVEEIYVADANVYAGRRLHDNIVPDDDISPEKRSFQVASEEWGLTGKADALRRRDGQWIVYEHKKDAVVGNSPKRRKRSVVDRRMQARPLRGPVIEFRPSLMPC